jgi:hypothetical protein
VEEELERREPKTYIRGKWELWFLVRFIGAFMQVLREHVPGTPRIHGIPITMTNAIDVLAPRTESPGALRAFLDRVLPA